MAPSPMGPTTELPWKKEHPYVSEIEVLLNRSKTPASIVSRLEDLRPLVVLSLHAARPLGMSVCGGSSAYWPLMQGGASVEEQHSFCDAVLPNSVRSASSRRNVICHVHLMHWGGVERDPCSGSHAAVVPGSLIQRATAEG